MEKKLSEMFLEKKQFNRLDYSVLMAMDIKDVKIYGEIVFLETRYTYTSSQFAAEECERELKEIAQEHGITGYKL